MRQFASDPNVIVAQSLVPNAHPFKGLFRKDAMRLTARIGRAKDGTKERAKRKTARKAPGVSFFSPFLPLAFPGVDPALFYNKAG